MKTKVSKNQVTSTNPSKQSLFSADQTKTVRITNFLSRYSDQNHITSNAILTEN